MAGKYRQIKMLIALTLLSSGTAGFVALSSLSLGVASRTDAPDGLPLDFDSAAVPQPVQTDARRLAAALFGKERERNIFTEQVLSAYAAAKDMDVVIFFNPGGWGWRRLVDSPYWPSIAAGIETTLTVGGLNPLSLDYRRSDGTFINNLAEFRAVAGLNSRPARLLAARVEFLTGHIPGLSVILTGESNGTIICDEVMKILKGNSRLASVQTGTPFWHKGTPDPRSLVINDNGIVPDTFSRGDFITMLRSNIEVWVGIKKTRPDHGTILNWFEAPGHYYVWENPTVRAQIEDFLKRTVIGR